MAENTNSLFERWPKTIRTIPCTSLGKWPTPVEPMNLSDGRADPVWIKRDDLSSPLYGGNKVRKLEFLLAGPRRAVLTFGAKGSHHVLATAIHARTKGHLTFAALFPQPMNPHHEAVGGLVNRHCDFVADLSRLSGAPRELARLAESAVRRSRETRGLAGLTVIPPGASSAAGTLGYVAAGMEIASQVRAGVCPLPRRIYVALGTGGTAAGLALGLALEGLDTEVAAVRVASRAAGNSAFLKILARNTMKILQKAGIEIEMPELNIKIDHRFIGPGYAHSTREAIESTERAGRAGLVLETTYTGKAMAAMLADGRARPGMGPLMFIDTFGPIDGVERATASRFKEKQP